MTTRYAVLGTIEAHASDQPLELGHAVQRRVLAVMAVHAGQVVSSDQIVESVWHENLPHRARNTLHTYIARLRQVESVEILRRPGGYLLDVAPESVDLHRFRSLIYRSHDLADPDAACLLDEALGLWRGEPFDGADTPWFTSLRTALVEERFTAWLRRNDIALRSGGHSDLVPDLTAAAAEHPLDERLAWQLFLALYRDGRQAEALQRYEELRRRLAEELGADPSPELRLLHLQMLTDDAAIAPPARHAVPRQLPAPPLAFVGRASERALLDAASNGVVVVGGPGGVGKTSLVLRWAHDHVDAFPDGQLYVNLRGFDPSAPPSDPAAVLRGFLDALRVLPERMPADLDDRGALFRELVAGRRMLVVLDNALNEDQVRPLLPGGTGCLVIVTSRHRLTGLVATQQARPIGVPMLAVPDAVALLTQRLGKERVRDTAAVDGLIRLCAGLPLALAVVAARALADPGFPLSTLVSELHDERGRLDALDAGDPASSVRAVTSWSYQRLSPAAARLFRLLGAHPGPDIDVDAATALAGEHVRPLLAELTRAHVLTEHLPGRFALHDLMRAFARDEATRDESRDALHRVLDHYLHTGFAAERRLSPHWPPITLTDPCVTPLTVSSYDAAIAWFAAERAVLLAVTDLAARDGWDVHAWQLPWTLSTYLTRSGRWDDRATTQLTALAAARRLGDHAALAEVLHLLGRAHSVQGDQPAAIAELTEALASYRALGDRTGEAITHFSLSLCHARGNDRAAVQEARQALELARCVGTRAWEAFSLSALGWYHAQFGEHELAVAHSTEALTLLDEVDDRDCEAHTVRTLGFVHQQRGDHASAVGHHERACALFRELGDSYSEAVTADQLGDALNVLGRSAAAREAWQRAEALFSLLELPETTAVRSKLSG
ncbi:BTAD domain-containing putative transcriptional regulator [Lentzea sp. NPDC051838]|uniref:AfsR/SARP family transcriptional regulator n=1 Tax=Lentzea sp. NPDC051838 TaxID=3154849 RepID=UPI00341A4765